MNEYNLYDKTTKTIWIFFKSKTRLLFSEQSE